MRARVAQLSSAFAPECSDVWLEGGAILGAPQGCPLAVFFCNLRSYAWNEECRRVAPDPETHTYLDDRFVLASQALTIGGAQCTLTTLERAGSQRPRFECLNLSDRSLRWAELGSVEFDGLVEEASSREGVATAAATMLVIERLLDGTIVPPDAADDAAGQDGDPVAPGAEA